MGNWPSVMTQLTKGSKLLLSKLGLDFRGANGAREIGRTALQGLHGSAPRDDGMPGLPLQFEVFDSRQT